MTHPGDSHATKYYNSSRWWGQEIDAANRERIERTLALIPSDVETVLDLGCGDGQVSNHLVNKGIKVIGTDISYTALQYFQGDKIIASADALPFSDNSFDLILSSEVLEHLPDHVFQSCLQEVERVAKKHILISTPNEEHLPTSYVKCMNCSYIFHANLHFRVFDRESHTRLFSKFAMVKIDSANYWKHYPVLTTMRHKLGGFRYREGLICPHCGKAQTGDQTVFQRIVNKGFDAIKRVVPKSKKARWLISLYRAL